MELRHLRYFVAVAESEHFGRAAAQLRVSQPALSQQIADLEREVGVALFARLPRGVRLNEAGRAFLETARAALRLVDDGAAHARAIGRGLAGRLVIGLPEASRGTSFALAALGQFRAEHPDVEVVTSRLGWIEQPRALLDGRLDVGFAWSAGAAPAGRAEGPAAVHLPGLSHVRLFDDPGEFALLPADHPLAARPSLTPADLAPAPFGLFARALHPPLHDAITAALAAVGVPPPVVADGIGAASATGPLLAATR